MKKRTIPLALTALLFAAAVGAQDGGLNGYDPNAPQTIPEGYNNAGTEKPEGYDGASSEKPEGYDSQQNTQLSTEMQNMVDGIVGQQQSQLLSGDEGSACEAILCLSTGGPPSECAASLRRYFSINLSKPWKTIQARINFLKLCPSSDDSPQMNTLVEAIGHGAGRCDAASLNQSLRTWTGIDGEYEISNQMPSYCEDYFRHEYTDVDSIRPRYVDKYVVRTYTDSEGNTHVEYDGGYWVDGQSSAPVASNTGNGAIPASKDPAAVGY
ncbi:MAG: TrbM/KikA/MpfK family conjugal transfer protein [Pseudomonadota bacterium]